jgi:AbrB family looped-hinge helix DNA binding protein
MLPPAQRQQTNSSLYAQVLDKIVVVMVKYSDRFIVMLEWKMETEIVVKKKGQTTIPVRIRKKLKIEEGTRLEVIVTADGILLKPKKSFWDLIGSGAPHATVEEIKKELDKMRAEDV